MINECNVLKELFLDLEGNKVSEEKDADYSKIETLMGSCGKEKLSQALEGLDVFDALMRDMTGESSKIAMHSLSVFCSVLEVKPEIVKRPETVVRGVVSILQANVSVPKASNIVVKALKCISLICPSVGSLGKEGPAIKKILHQCVVDSENSNGVEVQLHALILLKSLLQFKLIEFTDTSNWLQILFSLIFNGNASIREAAVQTTDFFKHQLNGKEDYLDVLANNIVPTKFSKLLIDMITLDRNWAVIWRLLVEILGTRLHNSSSLVNSLLAVEERAFKTSNIETKKEAFNCWNALLHNFALDQCILSSERRVKLLTIPLRANNCRNGDVALVKLNVWWNIIRLMRSDVTNFSDMVLTPFLCFCYGGLNESSVPIGPGRLNNSNTGEACAKLYPILRAPSLHCLCEILSTSAKLPLPTELKDLAVQPLVDPPIVNQKVFCSLSRLLTQSLGEAVNLGGHDAQQMPYVIHCWNSLLTLASLGCDEPLYNGETVSKDMRNIAMVKELLRLMANLVESAVSFEGKTTVLIVSMMESMVTGDFAFPPSVLNSHTLGVGNLMVMNSFPSLYLSTLLMTPAFAVDKKLHPRIKDVFSKLIQTGCSNILSPLPFARTLLKKMEKDTNEQSPNVIMPYFLELWVLIANHLSEVIDKEGSVSEGDGAGHDFHCMHGMLLLPISYSLKTEMSQEILEPALKSWTRLFELFVINAQLVVTAQSHEIVEELCKKILSLCKKGNKSWACLANGIQFILLMYQKPYFDSLWKSYAKNVSKGEKPTGLPSSQQLLVLLTSKISTGLTNTSDLSIDCKDDAIRHKTIIHYFILIFTSSSSFSTMNVVLEKGIQCISFYFKLSADSQENQLLRNEVIPLWDKFLHFLEKIFPYCTSRTQALVDSLSPLFLEAFKHPLAQIVEKTKLSWNGSLGQYFSNANIPKTLSDVLDDALKDTRDSEDVMGNMVSMDTQKGVFAMPERKRGKNKSITVQSPKAKDVLRNNIPPEDSVEFKVIPSKPKSSVLTDHQREMMKERRVDIPALYQDLTQDSVSQSFSQESQAVPVLKSVSSALTEEDANPPFSQTLQAETGFGKVKGESESEKVLTFKLPSSETSNSPQKRSSSRSSPVSEPNKVTKTVQLDAENGDLEPQATNSCGMNDTSKIVPAPRRRGRKRKQSMGMRNAVLPLIVIESAKPIGDDKVLEKSSPITPSDPEKMDRVLGHAELLPIDETGNSEMLTGQPNLQGVGNDLGSVSAAEVCNTAGDTKKLVLRKDNVDNVPKDTVKVASVSKTSDSSAKDIGAADSPRVISKISTADASSLSVSNSGDQPVTDTDRLGVEDGIVSSSVSENQVSKALPKSANVTDSASNATGCEVVHKVGLTNVKMSSPRKISNVEFSSLRSNAVDSDRCTPADDTPCVSFDSPNSKSPSVSFKSRAFPVSPKSKSIGNSPSLDKWVIVTKRENEDKSPVKSPSKPVTLDGMSKNIPVVVLDSDGDDVSDTVEVMKKTDEIYVFSNSEDLVDSSQDPMDSPSIPRKGPVKKCSVNLPRVSDIFPEEVAFIQYEGRTVKCNMSPRKEGKADEEAKKVGQVSSPVVANIFSPRNSRGARMLTMAQGNKEKSGADENPESPVRDAANKVALQNSDSNLLHSPLSHLKSFDADNSTPPSKKPRRIRPMHIGNVSPQYKSLEIGCVANEGEVTIHSYSPNASPGGSVMKRKKPSGEDSISPLSKKVRRVSFADPIVSRQVEFCVPESERQFKKRAVHRCLKLPGVSPNGFQPGAANANGNYLEVTSPIKRPDIPSSPLSTPTESNDTSDDDEMPVLFPCGKLTSGPDKVQETRDTIAPSDLAVEVLEMQEDSTETTGGKDDTSISLSDDKEPEMLALPAEEPIASTNHVAEKDNPSKDTEPIESEMEVESIDAIPPVPAGSESHADGEVREEPLPSSQGATKDDERLSENLEIAGKASITSPIPASKQDSSTDISDNSDKTVSSPDIRVPAAFLSDFISSSHQSLDSPKTPDSSEPSVLESDVEEPRTDKLNTQEEIYPPLRDCQDSVMIIIDKLTTKLWKERCRQSLERKRILTIGDLSRLTEDLIERIPFKAPKWKNAKAELKEYHTQLSKADQTSVTPESSQYIKPAAVEVDVGANSDLQDLRETLSKVSVKDLWKELQSLNMAEALLQEIDNDNTSATVQNVSSTKRQTRSDRMGKMSASPKTFESISVQVSEFEVLSELELMAKKKGQNQEESTSVSSQVSESDLLPIKSSGGEPNEITYPAASKVFQSTSTNVTESDLEEFVGKPVQVPKMSMSTAVQVSGGDILSRMGSYEVLLHVYNRSDFKDVVGELSSDKLMKLLKVVVRNAHNKVHLFDGSVDLIAKRILQCVVEELINGNESADTVKVIMWILQKTLFTKEYIKVIPSILSSVNENVISELILNHASIMDSIQSKLPASRGLKMAVDVLEQRNITLLPEEEIDRLNDILDNHRTCGELFDRYTRIVRDRIMGNNISR